VITRDLSLNFFQTCVYVELVHADGKNEGQAMRKNPLHLVTHTSYLTKYHTSEMKIANSEISTCCCTSRKQRSCTLTILLLSSIIAYCIGIASFAVRKEHKETIGTVHTVKHSYRNYHFKINLIIS
jgi:hypothetical protein